MLLKNSNNEQELIYLITQGSELAFAKLFDHYRNYIYSIALKLTRSTIVAEEIVQDVFLKIWIRKSGLNEIENFSAYLFAITRNETYKILKQIAKSHNAALPAEDNELPAHDNTEDHVIGKEYTSLLQKAVDRLPQQQKEVYRLVKEEELKRKDVANLLHLQPETVKFHLAQAMKNIRTYCMLRLHTVIVLTVFLSYHI